MMKRLALVLGSVAVMGLAPAASALASEAIIEVAKCPTGYTGVVVTVNGNSATVCQNIKP